MASQAVEMLLQIRATRAGTVYEPRRELRDFDITAFSKVSHK